MHQIIYGHLDDPEGQELVRGVSYLKLRPGEKKRGRGEGAAQHRRSSLCFEF